MRPFLCNGHQVCSSEHRSWSQRLFFPDVPWPAVSIHRSWWESPAWGLGTQPVLQHSLLWALMKGRGVTVFSVLGIPVNSWVLTGTEQAWSSVSRPRLFWRLSYRLSDCLLEATHSLMLAGTHLINLCQLDRKKKFRFVSTSLITCEMCFKK